MTNKSMKPFSTSNNRLLLSLVILAGTMLLYFNTIGNQYCLDDAIVITKNEFTKQGISGIPRIFTNESFTGFFGTQKQLVSGSRYRPLSIATFAVEHEYFGNNPTVSHSINILLYALTGILIFLLLSEIITDPRLQMVPFISALLFIFHPIHTEVVANIKGRDEIMALLFSLAGCLAMVKFIRAPRYPMLFLAAFLWLLGLFSKENAIVFWVIMPIILYISGVKEPKRFFVPILAFSLSAFVFLFMRHLVIGEHLASSGELMNDSFAGAASDQKYATIFYVLWKYVQLLFYPVPLTYDYYPYHIQLVNWSNVFAITGLVLYILLGLWFLFSLRRSSLVTFSIAIYLLSLLPVSNLFFPIGTFMSERFIYFSSLGFCILIALLLLNVFKKLPSMAIIVIAGILVLFGLKTFSRNKVWFNDYTLFTTDVQTSGNSAKSNCSAGGVLLESLDSIKDPQRKMRVLNNSVHYLKKALTIHPAYHDAILLLGNAYYIKGEADSAVSCYTRLLTNNPLKDLAFTNMLSLTYKEKDADKKINILKTLLAFNSSDFKTNYLLGSVYGKEKNDLDQSIYYLKNALQIDPGSKDANIDLGVAYGLKKDFPNSAQALQKASEIDPNDPNILINLGVTYKNMHQEDKAAAYFERAKKLRITN